MENCLRVLSLSYQNAGLDIREKFSFTLDETETLYSDLNTLFKIEEALVIYTCNRFEIYYYHSESVAKGLLQYLCHVKSIDFNTYFPYYKMLEGDKAMRYLFRVAVGLESQVLGDLEIYGQVNSAYQTSLRLNMSGLQFNKLMHLVFYCHKIVNQNTLFKSGAASISYNVFKLVSENFEVDKEFNILIIGAGKMGANVARHFSQKNKGNVYVTNRTDAKAYELSEVLDINFVPFNKHRSYFDQFNVIVSTITCSETAYYKQDIPKNISYVIDVSSPRSVDENVSQLGIKLFNVDDLGELVDEVITQRKKEIPKVEEEISVCERLYQDWLDEMVFSDHVKKFKTTLEEIKRQTMRSMMKKMDESQQLMAEEITARMINKIIKLPVIQLKSACKRGEVNKLSESLNALFNTEIVNNVKS